MKKKIIITNNAPSAIGPYNQGITFSNFIFTSGQLPIDPNTGEIVKDNIETQTTQSLKNIEAILMSQGSSLNKIIKTTIYLSNIKDFEKMNETYEKFFDDCNYPSRTAIEVAKIPKNALIEIEAIAHI